MANRECHQERLAELNQRLAAALNAMDYEVALACQMEIDDLRRQRVTRQPSRQHFYLMQRTAASPLPIITRHCSGLLSRSAPFAVPPPKPRRLIYKTVVNVGKLRRTDAS
jgi:hypothetical protein